LNEVIFEGETEVGKYAFVLCPVTCVKLPIVMKLNCLIGEECRIEFIRKEDVGESAKRALFPD
jgi:hypothetical protein